MVIIDHPYDDAPFKKKNKQKGEGKLCGQVASHTIQPSQWPGYAESYYSQRDSRNCACSKRTPNASS